MTIKWVQVDPLVMNGEPFCYGSRLTVRQLLEMRRSGYDLTRILTDQPELRRLGIAFAYCYAAGHPERYAEFLRPDGSLTGPGWASASRSGRPCPPSCSARGSSSTRERPSSAAEDGRPADDVASGSRGCAPTTRPDNPPRRSSIPTRGLVFPRIGATLRASRRDPAAPSRALHDGPATHQDTPDRSDGGLGVGRGE